MSRHRHFTHWPAVEGYTDHRSFRPGEPVAVHCAGRTSRAHVRVLRVGVREVEVWSRTDVAIHDHPTPDDAWATGCDWPVAFTIDTQPDWPPGFYIVELRADGDDTAAAMGDAWFVLRGEPGPARPALVQLGTNTWNAYNQWGGRCLYSGAREVSFSRPVERGYLRRVVDDDGYDGRIASVDPYDPEHERLQAYQARYEYPLWTASSGWHNWERRFVAWAERAGIALDYAIDADVHRDPAVLEGRRLLVTVGHSEYWSWQMRDHVDAFVDAGGNWAIFSGNTCFWQVRLEGDTMICHKGTARQTDPARDSDKAHLLTSMWSDPRIGRPENRTIGLSFTRGGYHRIGQAMPRGAGAYEIHRPHHWALEGTGLRYGDALGGLAGVVGYEVDGCALALEHGLPVPTGEDGTPPSLEIVASAPARLVSITADVCEPPEPLWASVEPPGDLEGVAIILFGDDSPASTAKVAHGRCVMGSFTRGDGTVFNAGSADWAYGLGADPLIERITRNVVDQLGGITPG